MNELKMLFKGKRSKKISKLDLTWRSKKGNSCLLVFLNVDTVPLLSKYQPIKIRLILSRVRIQNLKDKNLPERRLLDLNFYEKIF